MTSPYRKHARHIQAEAGAGYKMIRSIDARNFRCFKKLEISNCSRLNVIVGDNGAGKTTLLESIFLPLCSSTEVGARLRAQRGLDGNFAGPPSRIEAALWSGFFYNNDMTQAISLTLDGDGVDNRSLEISRAGTDGSVFRPIDQATDSMEAGISFTWRSHTGEVRSVTPIISDRGLTFPSTGENLDRFFYFPANQTIGSVENAGRFSDLSQSGDHKRFIQLFTKEYRWITDINVEVYGGSPVLFATLKGSSKKQPLPNVSSGINRAVAFMLAIASSRKGVVIVDEIENGIHHSHIGGIWRALLTFVREYECQLFVSTHSQECLMALSKAAGKDLSDIALWQLERGEESTVVKQFGGDDLRLALEYHEEVR